MPDRKAFLLRVDPTLLQTLQKWADDELRSLNGQIEWILRRAVLERRRARPDDIPETSGSTAVSEGTK
jgi:hypothetical protein